MLYPLALSSSFILAVFPAGTECTTSCLDHSHEPILLRVNETVQDIQHWMNPQRVKVRAWRFHYLHPLLCVDVQGVNSITCGSFSEGNTEGILPFTREFLIFVVSLRGVPVIWWLPLQVAFPLWFPNESQFKVKAPNQCAHIHLAPTVGLIWKHNS